MENKSCNEDFDTIPSDGGVANQNYYIYVHYYSYTMNN